MGRLVEAGRRERVVNRGGLESAGDGDVLVGGDRYPDRVAKYIPGEVIAGYMALDRNLVPDAGAFADKLRALTEKGSSFKSGSSLEGAQAKASVMSDPATQLAFHNLLPWLPLLIGLLFTPLYIWQLARNSGANTPWRTHAAVATLAFLVWAYAIQGSAFIVGFGTGSGIYYGNVAAAFVVFFTLVSGIFGPTPPSHDKRSSRGL